VAAGLIATGEAVEGRSEIDLVFESGEYLVFAEAKLDADLSPRTTYDPDRNQLIRVMDTVIEEAGDRTPVCWMITKDRAPAHLHTHLVARYRSDPSIAVALLPHRDPSIVRGVVDRLAVITWREILDGLADLDVSDAAAALAEVKRRI